MPELDEEQSLQLIEESGQRTVPRAREVSLSLRATPKKNSVQKRLHSSEHHISTPIHGKRLPDLALEDGNSKPDRHTIVSSKDSQRTKNGKLLRISKNATQVATLENEEETEERRSRSITTQDSSSMFQRG